MKRLKCFLISSVLMLSSSIPISATYNVITSKQKITVDGKNIDMESLNINGNNYLKAADTAKLLNIDISFDQSTNTIHFDKTKPFTKVRIVGEKQKNNSANEKQKYLEYLKYIDILESTMSNSETTLSMTEANIQIREKLELELVRISDLIMMSISETDSMNFYNELSLWEEKLKDKATIESGINEPSSGSMAGLNYSDILINGYKEKLYQLIDYYFNNNLNL